MNAINKTNKRDFTTGPLFIRLFLFAVPLMLSGLLQVSYNMADKIVVGQFSSDTDALAAIGSTSIVSTCIINFALGFSAGSGVIVAQHFGAKDNERLSKSIHTAVALALFAGLTVSLFGFSISRPILVLMETKPELLETAILYLRIICLGIPASILYNFGAAILRSIGDSKTSLYILGTSGLINVILNFFFVLSFDMGADGVALATIISQYASAIAVVVVMTRQKGACKFFFKKISVDWKILKSIVKVGLPAGIQSSLFAISNLVITKAFNTFPKTTVHARTVVQSVDGIVSTLITSYTRSTLALTAQNYGAGNIKRIKKVFFYSLIQTTVISFGVAQIILLFCRPIASLYIGSGNENIEEILTIAEGFFTILLNTYFLCGVMDIMSSSLRGMKYSIATMIISLSCAIPFRIGWVYLIFPHAPFDTANWLMASFPISWLIAIIPYTIMILVAWRKLTKKFSPKGTPEIKNAS
ncbi:MAG: MATE family efflux transporter [Clostridia bacterium]|nr:MATE family efflux transporter [Clostridia bacterium]